MVVTARRNGGQLQIRENYIDGVQDGLYEEFWSNGQLHIRGNYRDGEEVVQTRLTYRENGQLEYRTNYRDGEQDGLLEAAVDQSPLMQPQQIFTADQRGVILGCL